MQQENNLFKITLFGKDGAESNFAGKGSPRTTMSELMFTTPNGQEVVLFRENFKGFYVEPLELKKEEVSADEEVNKG